MAAESPMSGRIEGASYDVIRRRLLEQAAELSAKAESLNERRKKVFGGTELALIANERVRTENNCTARDIVSVGEHLLFGFQVTMGLKAPAPADVVSGYRFTDLSQPTNPEFLSDESFLKELSDTLRYGKDAQLLRLKRTDTRLFAVVRVGAGERDVKVFRWSIDAQGRVVYMDARGDEEMVPPPQHDIVWTPTTRENQVAGKHPHMNVLDTVFVETVGGDLTVKIENNTKDGRGIYREPVDDPNQTLDDAEIAYAKVGHLILLKIRPFREKVERFLVFDARAKKVVRIDAIGRACHELPEDHGIVFPGGYYLQSGEYKVFDGDVSELEFERTVKSPNGEDVLFVYHARTEGAYQLLPYNMIRKEVATPIRCHGYSLFADGTMAIMRASSEPTRVHGLQIWRTPFSTLEYAAKAPTDGSYLAKVGNADLVRGISDALSLKRLVSIEKRARHVYEDLVAAVGRAIDAHYWLGHEETGDLLSTLASVKKTCALVLDEFDKVDAIEKKAREMFDAASETQRQLLLRVLVDDLHTTEDYLRALTTLRNQRGQLITLRDQRGIDLAGVERLETEIAARFDDVSRATVTFFLAENAFAPLLARLDAVTESAEKAAFAKDLAPLSAELDLVQQGLTLLAEVIGSLNIEDATARTRILEGVSAAFAQQNRARAIWQGRKKELGAKEGRAEFAAQFRLFGQAVTGALALCDTPEACDDQLSKLLLALEELEGKFGDFEEFTDDLVKKREEMSDAMGARRQQLLDERQKRVGQLLVAADRILSGLSRRAKTFTTIDELNAYFAADAMVLKLVDVQKQVAALGDTVRADGVESRLKATKQEAIRTLRDKNELGDGVLKLGEHAFHVHTQPLELVVVPREGRLAIHLTGTEYFEFVDDAMLDQSRDLWDSTLPSESTDVYRAEYLAASMLLDVEDGKLSLEQLVHTDLLEAVRAYAQDRLDEGYDRGIHDVDAARILEKLLALRASAGLLRFAPDARAEALLHWSRLDRDAQSLLHARARALGRLREQTQFAAAQADLAASLALSSTAARYLVQELSSANIRFTASAVADSVCRGLFAFLDENGSRTAFEAELHAMRSDHAARLAVAMAYVEAFVQKKNLASARPYVREAAVMLVTKDLEREPSAATIATDVEGLLGTHPRIENRTMRLSIDEFLARLVPFVTARGPRFRAFRRAKADVVERAKKRLRVHEFTPKVLTSFVRNRLVDKVYLPLVGANLAKQIGAAGDKKRTDSMGMLLLVSPPGYGKTTLMEYVASKLGLVFMKVNGPSIGHEPTSLDPAEAKSQTARQEIEKINLAFEMKTNVMLYLDDIQHVSSELLQKFISLCDGQRKIEGVWNGEAKTYDLRGKKFCVVMAGNPYTETGARFQIPDMLANRADTYNLGDILGGQEELFASSYIENALTSNPTLAPLATREPADVHKLVAMARGETIPLTDLQHGYSAAEIEEVVNVLRHLLRAQKTLLAVNKEYIASASQDDAFRTEPPFKLQGSYRNMNKLAEKIAAAMNDDELERLIDDHYQSESQTLTTGAEQNLLKLGAIRGRLDDAQRARRAAILEAYRRTRKAGTQGDDPVARLTGALGGVDEQLQKIREAIAAAQRMEAPQIQPIDVRVDPNDALLQIMREHTRALETMVAALAQQQARPAAPPQLDAIVSLVKDLEAKLSQPRVAPRRYEVLLDEGSSSNFYRGLDGNDVLAHGGVFVATYAKLPPVGAPVQLELCFPGGIRIDVAAVVTFVQDEIGDASSGFGARITQFTNDARAVIGQFTSARDPLVKDSLRG